MLHINALVCRIGGRLLFDQATVHVPAGQRVGLVGKNGAGKTTLLRLIAGDITPDGGEIRLRPRTRLGRVAQQAPDGPESLIDHVLAADGERARLLAQAEGTHGARDTPLHIAEIHERLNAIAAHSAPARAARILSGLGFDEEQQARPLSSFSGGWRMRVALAAALFSRPDLLLLDEPTNHLDLEATLWLESHLAVWPGTLIIISHDRGLLNAVPQRILHLENARLTSYGGNYDTFEKTRREKAALQAKALSKQLEQRRRIMAFVDRFRYKATKARQAQSRLKMLERMEPVAPVVEERAMVFDFPDPAPLPPPLITFEDVALGYDGRAVLRRLSFRLDQDDRIVLLGDNGNGKSTLAKALSGRLKPLSGQVRRASGLRVGYFAQHQEDELDPARTAFHHMAALMPMATETAVRAHLGRFGFEQDRADVTADALSGGEKARLLLALATHNAPHVLVLDEPTNHLDIDARASLVAALNAFDGAVVLISHDPYLVELAAERLWLVEDGSVRAFDGDLADYRRLLMERAREARRAGRTDPASAASTAPTSRLGRKEDRRAAATARARLAPLRKQAKETEKRMERLHAQKQRIEAELADPSLYEGPADKIGMLQKQLGETEKAVAQAEADWLEAHEALEQAEPSDERAI